MPAVPVQKVWGVVPASEPISALPRSLGVSCLWAQSSVSAMEFKGGPRISDLNSEINKD